MQFEFPGALDVPDGRYLARGEDGQRVLVVETIGAPPPPRRRRGKPKEIEEGADPAPLPLSRVSAVWAEEPFDEAGEADAWLEEALTSEDLIDAVVAEGVALLNRAVHAHAIASANQLGAELRADQAATVRIGFGSGKEVASGRYTSAHEVDVHGGQSQRRRRDEELRPQERVAAVLGGRERFDACETLLLRARTDLDAGRLREAALQLRVAVEAMLIELDGALADPDHERDMSELQGRRTQAGDAANAALRGELPLEEERNVEELTAICERILRRRRVLRG